MKILPFTLGEQAEIRRLLRQADPARDLSPADIARIEQATLAALAAKTAPGTGWMQKLSHLLFGDGFVLRWPAAAMGAMAAGILMGNFIAAPLDAPAPGGLIAVAASEPWQQYADDLQGDNQ